MIMTMFYNTLGGFQTQPVVDLNNQQLANTLTGSDTNGVYTTDAWDKRVFSDLGNSRISNPGANTPNLRAIVNLANQTAALNTEFWCRVLISTRKTNFGSTHCGDLVTINDATGAAMLSVGVDGSTGVYAKILGADGATVLQQLFQSGSIPVSTLPIDQSNKRMSLDFRIKLDELAGFVQVYGYAGNLLGEWVGPTINTAVGTRTPTAARLYCSPTDNSYDNLHEFSIFADESTQNMYVMPLFAASAGTHNEQLSGTFTDMGKRIANIPASGGIALRLSGTEKKKVTAVAQSPSVVGLPANYIVKAVALGATAEAVNSSGAAVPISFMLKPSGGEFIKTPVLGIAPNLSAAAMRRAQSRLYIYNTNPVNSAAWTVTDISGMEFGIEAGG